ncbi:hypothetical protein Tco_0788155, partial [Tanacetum coccineum]
NYGAESAGYTQDNQEHKKEHHDPSTCRFRRFRMIKYSFDVEDEYVAIKEHECSDHSKTNIDTCQAYRELFRIMDEGWLVTKAWCQLVDSPIILEAMIEGFLVQRIYVNEGSSSEVMYDRCFRNLRAETRAKLKESRTPLVGFSGKVNYPMGTINLNVTMGESERLQAIPMEFAVVKSHSPYNVILGRTDLKSLGVVASTIHSMIKFPPPMGSQQ